VHASRGCTRHFLNAAIRCAGLQQAEFSAYYNNGGQSYGAEKKLN